MKRSVVEILKLRYITKKKVSLHLFLLKFYSILRQSGELKKNIFNDLQLLH